MESKTIVCFGDSNTHGYDAQTGGRFDRATRWTARLARLLGEGYEIREEGLSGRTTVFEDPLHEGMSGLSFLRPCLMTHEPVDLLILMLGTNDVKARFGATANNIARGIERLILHAKTVTDGFRHGKPNILLLCPPPIEPRYYDTTIGQDMGAGCAEKSARLGALYEQVAAQHGCAYLNLGRIAGIEMWHHDYMHLSPAAHAKLAELLAAEIPRLLCK